MLIRPPQNWILDKVSEAIHLPETLSPAEYWTDSHRVRTVPAVRRLGFEDLMDSLARGFSDFAAFRTDVLFMCIVYPVVGLLLARLASGNQLLSVVFPLISGFALIGPFAAVGLNEMSRRRELGRPASWTGQFGVLHSPALGGILLLGFTLAALLVAWLVAAQAIYLATLGPEPPVSLYQFAWDVLMTPAGWTMIAVGIGVGFLFALVVLTISSVAFPMMLDRNVTIDIAVRTSVRVMMQNKRVMAAWGLIVSGLLVLGSIPALLGLIIVMPVLGHATWHLYRAAVSY